jgi:hypothetical protein
MKRTGKPGAGKPHAGFDEAGAGDGLSCTAPVLDPTRVMGADLLNRVRSWHLNLKSKIVISSLDYKRYG